MPVFCLSVHAPYRCRHSGACCTSGWAIPVEAPLHARLRRELSAGRVELPGDQPDAFIQPEERPEGVSAILKTDAAGACACYDKERHRCAIHSALGHDALPVSCQHFPRVCLIDEGTTSVTLSHYCPTAASLLFEKSSALEVVEAPPSFAPMDLEGLDARGALPPLLHPGMLMDREAYRRWEKRVVAALAEDTSAEEALTRVIEATETLRRWQPAHGPLQEAVDAAFERTGTGLKPRPYGGPEGPPCSGQRLTTAAPEGPPCSGQRLTTAGPEGPPCSGSRLTTATLAFDRLVRQSVPPGLPSESPPENASRLFEELVSPTWVRFAGPVRRFLAAHAFANWCSYQGRGLRTVVCSLVASLSVLRVEAARQCGAAGRPLDASRLTEAFRSADLLIVHLASREDLAHRLGAVEEAGIEATSEALS